MKKLLTSILASTLLLSTACFATEITATTQQEVETQQEIHTATLSSGKCGTNATYSYNSTTGTLTISGTGAMENYWIDRSGWVDTPWHSYCRDIKSLVIGEGITSIGDYAFYNSWFLTSVTIPDSVTSIGDHAFGICSSLTSVTIPDSVTSIESGAFYGCSSLTSVTIPDSVTSIGANVFSSCDSLTSVTIPDSVTSIGSWAFYYCSSLTSVTIPDSVISIGESAFQNCSSLSTVYYGGNEADRKNMDIVSVNSELEKATWNYNHNDPSWAGTTPTVAPSVSGTSVLGFSDVRSTDWFASYVEYVRENSYGGLMEKGFTSTSFNPYGQATRGMVAEVVTNLFYELGYGIGGHEHGYSSKENFPDAVGSEFELDIYFCKGSIFAGYPDGTVGVNDPITREAFAVALYAAYGEGGRFEPEYLLGIAPTDTSTLNQFSDKNEISSWATTAVAWAVSNGVMGGSDGAINPQGNLSRAELAVVAKKCHEEFPLDPASGM